MLELFVQEYGLAVLAILGGIAVAIFFRRLLLERSKRRQEAEIIARIREAFAIAADQGQHFNMVIPQWDGEEMYLGLARYIGGHAEGMVLELWISPGSPVLEYERIHGYFQLKHMGPISFYDFFSSMHEYSRDGNRVEVIVPWPTELGHGQRREFSQQQSTQNKEALVRLWRAREGADPSAPQGWEPIPARDIMVTDISGTGLQLGLEAAQRSLVREGTHMLCRMHLPHADAEPVQLVLAGQVSRVKRQPNFTYDVMEISWQRWALPAEMSDIQWHKLAPAQTVPLLHNWVSLRQQGL